MATRLKSDPAGPVLGARAVDVDFQTRSARLLAGRGGPSTLDEANRTVEVVAATELPVTVFDFARWEPVQEVLLMSGISQIPESAPLIDSHSRETLRNMAGSAREFRVDGSQLLARMIFSGNSLGQEAWTMVREGHLTDVSIGYRIDASTWIEAGRTVEIDGRGFTGPMRVVTNWSIKELSLCPIGADEAAKVRAANHKDKERAMKISARMRAYLETRGLAKDATDDEARRFLADLEEREGPVNLDQGRSDPPAPPADPPAPPADPGRDAPPAPPAPPVNPEGQRSVDELMQSERTRAAEIMDMGRVHGIEGDELRGLLVGNYTLDQAGRAMLGLLAERSGIAGGGGHRHPARVLHDERDRFRAASIDSLLVRAGIPVDKPAAGHEELMGLSLRELARDCLRRAGQRTGGYVLDWVGRALTTSDLPNILMDVANKSILFGWDSAPETWQLWCGTGQTSDFKPGHEVRLGEFDDLDEMKENDEYKYAGLKDAQEAYQIATFGKAFRIGRQTLIDDDLGMLTSVPQAMGEAASRTVGDVAWAALISNATMGDNKALFCADHGNIKSIAAFDVAGLGLAIQQMTAQKDLNQKRRIRVIPVFFLSPTSLFVTAEKFFGSDVIGTQGEPNVKNPFSGTFRQENRIYEPRLDDFGVNVFFLAGPKGRTVKVFFLNGVQKPFMDAENDWNTDGRKFKVRIDVGSKAMDWRGLQQTTITG